MTLPPLQCGEREAFYRILGPMELSAAIRYTTKRQIVIGLLCDQDGHPVSIEVFPGNTQDPHTFAAQLEKVKGRFGVQEITFVGDRGMIKGQQIADLAQQGFHYITAITKPQMEKLLRQGTVQMDLFDQELAEVLADEGLRYVLRRNPVRAQER